MARPTSEDTTPRLISQSKKVSPASPDHRVPSQSNADTRGARRRTLSTNCVLAWKVVSGLAVSMHFDDTVRCGNTQSGRRELLLQQSGVVFGSIDVQPDARIVDREIVNVLLISMLDVACISGDRFAQKHLD